MLFIAYGEGRTMLLLAYGEGRTMLLIAYGEGCRASWRSISICIHVFQQLRLLRLSDQCETNRCATKLGSDHQPFTSMSQRHQITSGVCYIILVSCSSDRGDMFCPSRQCLQARPIPTIVDSRIYRVRGPIIFLRFSRELEGRRPRRHIRLGSLVGP